jgi:hypothetical protein
MIHAWMALEATLTRSGLNEGAADRYAVLRTGFRDSATHTEPGSAKICSAVGIH